MSQNNKKLELLSSAPVPKALLAIGIPTMIGMMINALYNLVDAYFVGKLGTPEMGAISVAFPIGQVLIGIALLFGNGAASYISRLLGKGDIKTAGKAASTALYISIGCGATAIVLLQIFLEPVLDILGATPGIMPAALSYTRIFAASCILNVFNVTMNNIVTSEGHAKTTMTALLSGAVLNIVLDPVFIFVLHLGIAGAAIATAISQFVSTCVYIAYIAGKKSTFSFSVHLVTPSKIILKEIFKIGIPTLIFQLLTSLAVALTNIQAKPYGDSVIAGMGAVTRIIAMGSLMVFGFIKGFQPVAGFSYGAKNFQRLKEAVRISVLWSTIFCTIFGLISALFPTAIILLFTKADATMLSIGVAALRANGLSFILFGFYTTYSSLFLALGKGKEGFILGACRQGICFIPVILVLPALFGEFGIIAAQPCADVLSAIIAGFVYLHQKI